MAAGGEGQLAGEEELGEGRHVNKESQGAVTDEGTGKTVCGALHKL